MITASQFARQYASAWATLSPMSEEFVRHVNGASCERVYSPVRFRVSPLRRSLVNEIAFRIFMRQARDGSRSKGPSDIVETTFHDITRDERWARLGSAAP